MKNTNTRLVALWKEQLFIAYGEETRDRIITFMEKVQAKGEEVVVLINSVKREIPGYKGQGFFAIMHVLIATIIQRFPKKKAIKLLKDIIKRIKQDKEWDKYSRHLVFKEMMSLLDKR